MNLFCLSRLDRQLLLGEPIKTIPACRSLLFGFGPDHACINPRVEHLGQVLIRASLHIIDRILLNVFRLHPYHLVLVGCITILFVHLPDVKSCQHKLQNNNSMAQHLLKTAWMEALVLEDVFYKRSLISLFSQASRRRRGSRNLPFVIALRGCQIAQKLYSPRSFFCLHFLSSPATVLSAADSIYCTDQLMRSLNHVAAWNLASNGHNTNGKCIESCELI